jgi:hypothetical protein
VIKSRRIRWAGYVARVGNRRGAYKVMVWKTEEKIPLGRPKNRWEDTTKMNIYDVGWRVWTRLI